MFFVCLFVCLLLRGVGLGVGGYWEGGRKRDIMVMVFYVSLFSALEQTHCAFACVTVF